MEELKLILETIEKLGGDAKIVAIIWFSLKAFNTFLPCLLVFTLGFFGYKIGKYGVSNYSFGQRVLKKFASAWSQEHKEKILGWLEKNAPNDVFKLD